MAHRGEFVSVLLINLWCGNLSVWTLIIKRGHKLRRFVQELKQTELNIEQYKINILYTNSDTALSFLILLPLLA